MEQLIKPKTWQLSKIWDEVFDKYPEPIIPRDYLYASEVGSSFLEVFLKMRGVQPTNYPTSVARMKMEAGKVWESIVRMVLKRAGILKGCQKKVDFNLKGLLSVRGRLDFIGGGIIDLDQVAESAISLKLLWQELDMPEIYTQIADKMIDYVTESAYNERTTIYSEEVLEVKSVSKYVWDMIESTGKPAAYHVNQIFHYSHGLNKPVGRIVYINRDDCRIKELEVYNSQENLSNYTKWVTTMTDYWNAQDEPPRETLIGFNPLDFKFRKRTMEIEWSRYLTLIYGFKSPQEYRDLVSPTVDRFNRVFKRCVEAAKMTPKNLDVIKEAKVFFPEWDDLVDKAKAANVVLEDEPESEA